MNRVDRLHAIVTMLQSKRVVKAEELATRFQISLRTVYRDMRALEEGGIPIGAEAGIGYFLTEGFHLPPIMFTHQEARSILLAGKFLEKFSDKPTSQHFADAITKIKAVLDTAKKEELESLDNKILINPFASPKRKPEDLHLDTIKKSLSNNNVLLLWYCNRDQNEVVEREIEPIGICYYYSNWHLFAYCRLRNDYRDFRLDRIQNIKVLPERYLRIKHPSLKEYIGKLISETELVTITIRIDKKTASFMQDSKYQLGLISEAETQDGFEMTFASFSYDYFSRYLLSFGAGVEIVSPPEMKETFQSLIKTLAEKHLNFK